MVEEIPRKLRRVVGRLLRVGDEPVMIVPALVQRFCSERTLAMARIGLDPGKVGSYLLVTDKNLYLVRAGILWDSVSSIPLESITAIEYVDEFRTNTLKIRIGEAAENLIFYDDLVGIRFFRHIKGKISESPNQKVA